MLPLLTSLLLLGHLLPGGQTAAASPRGQPLTAKAVVKGKSFREHNGFFWAKFKEVTLSGDQNRPRKVRARFLHRPEASFYLDTAPEPTGLPAVIRLHGITPQKETGLVFETRCPQAPGQLPPLTATQFTYGNRHPVWLTGSRQNGQVVITLFFQSLAKSFKLQGPLAVSFFRDGLCFKNTLWPDTSHPLSTPAIWHAASIHTPWGTVQTAKKPEQSQLTLGDFAAVNTPSPLSPQLFDSIQALAGFGSTWQQLQITLENAASEPLFNGHLADLTFVPASTAYYQFRTAKPGLLFGKIPWHKDTGLRAIPSAMRTQLDFSALNLPADTRLKPGPGDDHPPQSVTLYIPVSEGRLKLPALRLCRPGFEPVTVAYNAVEAAVHNRGIQWQPLQPASLIVLNGNSNDSSSSFFGCAKVAIGKNWQQWVAAEKNSLAVIGLESWTFFHDSVDFRNNAFPYARADNDFTLKATLTQAVAAWPEALSACGEPRARRIVLISERIDRSLAAVPESQKVPLHIISSQPPPPYWQQPQRWHQVAPSNSQSTLCNPEQLERILREVFP